MEEKKQNKAQKNSKSYIKNLLMFLQVKKIKNKFKVGTKEFERS